MLKLPTKKGERVIVWHDLEQDADGPVRVVLISDGRGRWSMQTECGVPYGHEDDVGDGPAEIYDDGNAYTWDVGGSFLHDINGGHQRPLCRFNLDVAMDMRMRVLLRPEQKVSDPSFIDPGEHVVSITKGNRKLVVVNHGGACDGGSLLSIHTTKPLDGGHWIAALSNLALALDGFDKHYSGDGDD